MYGIPLIKGISLLLVARGFTSRKKRASRPVNTSSRTIPAHVRREVWRRDQGRCVQCESQVRLEYDHIIPFSKGGSNTARNIQLLCEKCNRAKSNQI
jgi:5-methylcytosine-specific restriction endonuclease McrA